jgi:Nup85 Nucleoporin
LYIHGESFSCVEDAWVLLSNHSTVRRLEDMDNDPMGGSVLDDYEAATLDDQREGFLALKDILLSAPLPGGRSSDDDVDSRDDEVDSGDHSNKGGQKTKVDTSIVEDEYIEGIPTSAYRLWETNDTDRGSGDFPVLFNPHAAYQVHQLWKEAVNGIPALQRLRRRIPEIGRILSLLNGDFRDIEFESWQEELCAELLYRIPNVRLVDMSTRAAIVMKKFDDPPKEFDQVILNIMRGNAGRVIQIMHGFLAGGSMAALPAVMVGFYRIFCVRLLPIASERNELLHVAHTFFALTIALQTSLLCQIFDDAQILTSVSDKYSLSLELLIGASFAIRSSLAIEGHHDLGARLAVRLLLPFMTIDSDVRITANLVNTLEHHSPSSDAEANTLLSLCRKLVERKNVRVLDGCVSICLARYQYYINESRPGGAVHWLLTGMDLESQILCDGPKRTGAWQRALSSGVCNRRLFAYFTETSELLLKALIGEGTGASLLYARAKEMVAAQEESNFAAFLPAVKLLENVVAMAGAIAERKDDSIVAASIVSCLEERVNEEDDGAVSSLARPFMHWDILRFATIILDRDANRVATQEIDTQSISSFDVRGMGVLLSTFTVISKSIEVQQDSNCTILAADLQQARLALAEGLKRAFVAENAMIKSSVNRTPRTSVVGIHAANFARYSREDQERAVKLMVEY